jgi:hypothetical protein
MDRERIERAIAVINDNLNSKYYLEQNELGKESVQTLLSLAQDYLKVAEVIKTIDIVHNDITPELIEYNFPKGQCKERGHALVLHAQMLFAIQEIIDKNFKDSALSLQQRISVERLEEIIDKVKIEGMLHILPNDRHNLAQSIHEEIVGKEK